jgi:peroxiredoxin Q/BCP
MNNMLLKEGAPAPAFELPSSTGQTVALKNFKGKKNVVLYFYPKDDTPGCTVEACGFRDAVVPIEKTGTVILGVSPDHPEKHRKFIGKYQLPFILLSDEDHTMCEAYGVWVEKSMYGRKYMGVARTTFIIDRQGKIVKIFEKVKPQGHQEEVLAFLKQDGF